MATTTNQTPGLKVTQAALLSQVFLKRCGVQEFKKSAGRKSAKTTTARNGKVPKQTAKSLTEQEKEILWECGQLDQNNPCSLINTMCWLLTMYFDLRGSQEHHDMKVEDFTIQKAGQRGKTRSTQLWRNLKWKKTYLWRTFVPIKKSNKPQHQNWDSSEKFESLCSSKMWD